MYQLLKAVSKTKKFHWFPALWKKTSHTETNFFLAKAKDMTHEILKSQESHRGVSSDPFLTQSVCDLCFLDSEDDMKMTL